MNKKKRIFAKKNSNVFYKMTFSRMKDKKLIY